MSWRCCSRAAYASFFSCAGHAKLANAIADSLTRTYSDLPILLQAGILYVTLS